MEMYFFVIVVIYVMGFIFSPFPYWKTYFILLHQALFNKKYVQYGVSRKKQISFLLKYALLCPIGTFLWYLDEILFPAYKQQQIKPIFIIGQPRSGTTFLHRTLANDDENFVAVQHIEWRYPYISLQKLIKNSNWVKKWVNRNYWPDTEIGRKAAKMHPNALFDWEEDGIFFEECFLHHFFIYLRFPEADLLPYLDDFESLPEKVQQHMLKMHRKVIQKVIYLRNGNNKFYLSKEVTSHNKVEKMLELYPDAKFIVSVRHSSGFMNSLLELVRFSTKVKTNVDPVNIPGWESMFIERMKKDSLLLVNLSENIISKDKQIHVVFNQFTSNIVPAVNYIYEQLGCQIGEKYHDYLENLHSVQTKREKGYSYDEKSYEEFEEFDEFVMKVEKAL